MVTAAAETVRSASNVHGLVFALCEQLIADFQRRVRDALLADVRRERRGREVAAFRDLCATGLRR